MKYSVSSKLSLLFGFFLAKHAVTVEEAGHLLVDTGLRKLYFKFL
jgi:hypothetical protein